MTDALPDHVPTVSPRLQPTRAAAGPARARPRTLAGVTESTDLHLPETGSGSLASVGARVLGFVVDAALSFLVGLAITAPSLPRNVSLLVLAVEYVVFTALVAQTPGMFVARIRLVRVDRVAPVGFVRAVVRTALLIVLVPALIWDRNNRGWHDRAAQVAVVRA